MRLPSFPRLALCTLTLLLPVHGHAASAAGAGAAKAAHSGNRYLIVVENSSAMQRRDERLRQAVFDLVYSGILGRMEAGDTFGIWLYNSEVDSRFPMQIWDPGARLDLGSRVNTYLRDHGYQHRANPEEMIRGLGSVVESVGDLTVVVFSDGNDKMTGTPFDREINAFYRELGPELEKAREPFITALVYERRQVVAYAVARPGEALSLPAPTRTSSGRRPGQSRAPATEVAEASDPPAKGAAGLRPARTPQPIVITRESNQAALAAAQSARTTTTPSPLTPSTNTPPANPAAAADLALAGSPAPAAVAAVTPPPPAPAPAPVTTTNVVVVVIYTNAPPAPAAAGGPPLLDPLDVALTPFPVAAAAARGRDPVQPAATNPVARPAVVAERSPSAPSAPRETPPAPAPPARTGATVATSPPQPTVSTPVTVAGTAPSHAQPSPEVRSQPPVTPPAASPPPRQFVATPPLPAPPAPGSFSSSGPLLLNSVPPLSLPTLDVHARTVPPSATNGSRPGTPQPPVTAAVIHPPGARSQAKLWAALALLAGALGVGAVHRIRSRQSDTGSYITKAMPRAHPPKADPRSPRKGPRK